MTCRDGKSPGFQQITGLLHRRLFPRASGRFGEMRRMSILDAPKSSAAGAGRYAPSPSGSLHIGNLRTALIAWLAARSRGAPFALRIEDLDRERSRPEHERSQLHDLAALGIDWDGLVMRQSERFEEHRQAFEALRAAGRVYPCWCSRADIREAASAPHGAAGIGRYPGTCGQLSVAARRRRAQQVDRLPAWRLDGREQRVRFHDGLRGICEGAVADNNARSKEISNLIGKLREKRPSRDIFIAGFRELRASELYSQQKKLVAYILRRFHAQNVGLPPETHAMTIEHITSQGKGADPDVIATVGNLLYVDGELNERLGARSFSAKKRVLEDAKGVWVDEVVRKSAAWDRDRIQERTVALAERAYDDLWPF